MMRSLLSLIFSLALVFTGVLGFAPNIHQHSLLTYSLQHSSSSTNTLLHARINEKRRKQLGINPDEDEYDLDFALDQNTDPLITKLIAGSLILVLIGLLVAGVVIPSLTDYGEGVCSPIQNGGRC